MAETISAVAALLWPVLLLVLILMFRRQLARVIGSAEQREWSLEVGGQKLSMKQLSDQQNSMIADLQKQVGVLSKAVAALTADQQPIEDSDEVDGAPVAGGSTILGEVKPPPPATAYSVLWVDDYPENNALIVEQLQRNGTRVDLARSTREGLALLGQRRYGAIVSDMGRFEGGQEVPDAGMRLLRTVRETDRATPFVIYSGYRSSVAYREQALEAGATGITASPAVLTELLHAANVL
ncbi:MAG TPA: response regulator [Actinophytocola sp.]|uniref:response regulator n=1 Tax=Actinophytocola sp. TaxID=1872138 RepID=UPI002E0C773F|nr:response regulator [Actinophytocola sp.]